MTHQIRIDDLAYEKLSELHDEIDGTKTGLASEAIRKGVEQLKAERDEIGE